jgi:hypothetical protein
VIGAAAADATGSTTCPMGRLQGLPGFATGLRAVDDGAGRPARGAGVAFSAPAYSKRHSNAATNNCRWLW